MVLFPIVSYSFMQIPRRAQRLRFLQISDNQEMKSNLRSVQVIHPSAVLSGRNLNNTLVRLGQRTPARPHSEISDSEVSDVEPAETQRGWFAAVMDSVMSWLW